MTKCNPLVSSSSFYNSISIHKLVDAHPLWRWRTRKMSRTQLKDSKPHQLIQCDIAALINQMVKAINVHKLSSNDITDKSKIQRSDWYKIGQKWWQWGCSHTSINHSNFKAKDVHCIWDAGLHTSYCQWMKLPAKTKSLTKLDVCIFHYHFKSLTAISN